MVVYLSQSPLLYYQFNFLATRTTEQENQVQNHDYYYNLSRSWANSLPGYQAATALWEGKGNSNSIYKVKVSLGFSKEGEG